MSTTIGIPLFYHPTKVLFIDDDEGWLNNVSLHVIDEFECLLEEDSSAGYNLLKQHTYDIKKLNKKITEINFDTFSVDYSQFSKLVNTASHRDKVVTVVIDYNMPKLNGLSFCRKARAANLPVRFILLTGAAGPAKAVDAFNDGIIDAYLDKNDPSVISKLIDSIRILSMRQFTMMSTIFGPIYSKINAFSDPDFINLFQDILKENNVNRFFVINESGSLILINDSGQRKIMAIKTDEDFDMLYDIAQDSGVSASVLKALKDRTGFPVTSNDTANLELKSSVLERSMVPMNKIPEKDIFYALVNI